MLPGLSQCAISLSANTAQERLKASTLIFPYLTLSVQAAVFLLYSALNTIPSLSHNVSCYFWGFYFSFFICSLWFLICDVLYWREGCQGGFLWHNDPWFVGSLMYVCAERDRETAMYGCQWWIHLCLSLCFHAFLSVTAGLSNTLLFTSIYDTFPVLTLPCFVYHLSSPLHLFLFSLEQSGVFFLCNLDRCMRTVYGLIRLHSYSKWRVRKREGLCNDAWQINRIILWILFTGGHSISKNNKSYTGSCRACGISIPLYIVQVLRRTLLIIPDETAFIESGRGTIKYKFMKYLFAT